MEIKIGDKVARGGIVAEVLDLKDGIAKVKYSDNGFSYQQLTAIKEWVKI